MRNNRRYRGSFNEDLETKKLVYISIAVVIIAILTFIITYIIYGNIISDNFDYDEIGKVTDLAAVNKELSSEASSSIGRSVNEVQEDEKKQEVEKIAINTSNIVKQSESTDKTENKENVKPVVKQVEKKVEKVPDPTFAKPVNGDIIREFAEESLVYSDTLEEWITHTAIDIKAEKATVVKASADGTVKSIKNDPRYGITVVIEHVNGFTTVYSNLLTAEFVKENEKVKQGQTIGTVGNTAAFEVLDEPHLHFELLKDNKYLNPINYIK